MLRKKYLASLAVAGVASLSIISVAHADGYESAGKAFVAPSKIINWTGAYIGGQVGYGWGDVDSDFDFGHRHLNHFLFDHVGLQKSFSEELEDWMYGGHLGVQWQHGNWVFGVEGTYDKTELEGSSSAKFEFGKIHSCGNPCRIGLAAEGTQALKTEIDNLWTLTGRMGYAWDRWLVYVKGGYARAEIDMASNIDTDIEACFGSCIEFGVGFSGSSEEDHHGWVVGAGTAYMVHKNVMLGFDYSYIDLESKKHTVDGAVALDFKKHDIKFPAKHWLDVDPDAIHAVSVRLTFLFGPEERVIAPLK